MARSFSFDAEFDSPVTEVWRVVSDTDFIDGAVGLPIVTYLDKPQEDGTTRRFAKSRKLGITFEYEEKPFEWVHEQFYEVHRVFSRGAYTEFTHRCELTPRDESDPSAGCTVRTTFEFKPRGLYTPITLAGTWKDVLRPYKKIMSRLDDVLKSQKRHDKAHSVILEKPVAVEEVESAKPNVNREALNRAIKRMNETEDLPLAKNLAEMLATGPDNALQRIQPKAMARRWRATLDKTLNTLLAATRAGALNLRWDVICPHCRGDKMNLGTLSDVKSTAFCSSCNIDFDVDLDRSLEVVFTPHPAIRGIPDAKYCLGGPGTTPHVVYQKALAAGESHEFRIKLAEGRYRVRATGCEHLPWLDFDPTGPTDGVNIQITDDNILGADIQAASGQWVSFKVSNDSAREVLVAMESVEWARDTLSAGELVADQKFRDLFSNEVLAPGVQLGIESTTILFTDVVGSTAMYERLGDAKAFNLVWTHFDSLKTIVARHSGAIVKTIGDAIMAVFTSPINALMAARDMHREVDQFVQEKGHEGVQLKIGLHTGACIAVTLNERLDYFGTTVNLAARIQDLSRSGDIVVSQSFANRTDDCRALRDEGFVSTNEHAEAKGFPEPVPVLRFTHKHSS